MGTSRHDSLMTFVKNSAAVSQLRGDRAIRGVSAVILGIPMEAPTARQLNLSPLVFCHPFFSLGFLLSSLFSPFTWLSCFPALPLAFAFVFFSFKAKYIKAFALMLLLRQLQGRGRGGVHTVR